MGSSKKHKRDSKKHKRRSRSRSRSRSPRHDHRGREQSRSYSPEEDSYEADRRRHKKHKKDRTERVERTERTERTERPERTDRSDRADHRHHRHHHHHPGGGGQGSRQRDSRGDIVEVIGDDSDSSDCVEVPLEEDAAPPPPTISRKSSSPEPPPAPSPPSVTQKRRRSPSPATLSQPPPPPPPPKVTSMRRQRSPSPIPENGVGDCLSIVETNKLRAKLGLKPLEVGPSKGAEPSRSSEDAPQNERTGEAYEKIKDDWGEFYHKPARNIAEKTQEVKIREKLHERREKRALEEKLKRLKTLGEDEEVDDVRNWVTKGRDKDRLRKEAEERARLLDQMDEEFADGGAQDVEETARNRARMYRDRDLAGLRVEHDVEAFTEGRQVILTLKDANVLDEETGDTLVNVNMVENERYKRNVENRKLNPNNYGYDVYCQDEVDEYGLPKARDVLGKYSEEIEGVRKSSFTIGSNAEEEAKEKRRLLEIKTKLQRKKLDSLETAPLTVVSDYYTESEVAAFKKPKKKVRKIRQKLKADDLLGTMPDESSTADLGSRGKRQPPRATEEPRQSVRRRAEILVTDDTLLPQEDLSSVTVEDDDEDLQAVLSKARRLKQKESIISKALPIDPERVKSEIKEEPEENEHDKGRDGVMLLNATAEFCRTLGDIPTYGLAGNREEDGNEMMDFEQDTERHDPEGDAIANRHGTWNSVNTEQEQEVHRDIKVEDVAILDEEPDVASSVAGALKLAQSKGYLEREESNRPSNARFAHLQAQNYSIEDKSHAEENDKYSRRDRYSGPIMDFKEKETFKPNVKLEYIDDNGHLLTPKEAFRYLSHKFHGKGPGKNKVEKRIKKSEQEGLMKKMSSTDTPLGTLNMLQAKQKETQSPFIVLSGTKQNTSIVKQKR